MSHSSISPPIIDNHPARADSEYNPSDLGNQISQELNPSAKLQVAGDNTFTTIPSTATSGQMLPSQLLQPPCRDQPAPRSPSDASSPASHHLNTCGSQLSTSPTTVFSTLDSEATDSPFSDFRGARSTSPAGSASAVNVITEESSSSISRAKPDPVHNLPMITRSRSLEGPFAGQSGMGPVRRGNSASERGKNAVGSIRVHRPAGIKWNQRTR
jgi:hypothetical protein